MGEDERKISVKKDMYNEKNCGKILRFFFCTIRPDKKEEPHFCGSKGEKVYEKVFSLRTITVYK